MKTKNWLKKSIKMTKNGKNEKNWKTQKINEKIYKGPKMEKLWVNPKNDKKNGKTKIQKMPKNWNKQNWKNEMTKNEKQIMKNKKRQKMKIFGK